MWILLIRAGEFIVDECADPWDHTQDGGLLAIRSTKDEAEGERDRINTALAAEARSLWPYRIPERSSGLAASCP